LIETEVAHLGFRFLSNSVSIKVAARSEKPLQSLFA